jgi:hypothetical protein
MVVFQAESSLKGESLLVIVIEQDNLERMAKADPITLKSKRGGGILVPAEHPENLRVVVALEKDSAHVYEFLERQDRAGLLQYLMRGYQALGTDGVPGGTGKA